MRSDALFSLGKRCMCNIEMEGSSRIRVGNQHLQRSGRNVTDSGNFQLTLSLFTAMASQLGLPAI